MVLERHSKGETRRIEKENKGNNKCQGGVRVCVVDLLLVGVMVSHRLDGDNRVRVGGGLWLHGSAETMNRCCGVHVGSLTKVGCGGACTSIYLRAGIFGQG